MTQVLSLRILGRFCYNKIQKIEVRIRHRYLVDYKEIISTILTLMIINYHKFFVASFCPNM